MQNLQPSVAQAVSRTIRLHPTDNVVIAYQAIAPGGPFEDGVCNEAIPAGHKVATAPIETGQAIVKFGQIIGFASQPIKPGSHVHTHNCKIQSFGRDPAVGADRKATQYVPEQDRATFQGIVREDGRVATRNYIGIMTTVNCSATVARAIADHFRGRGLENVPNVDGVVAFTHSDGCGLGATGNAIEMLRRTLGGYLRHPNLAGALVIGLGCETNQGAALLDSAGLAEGPMLKLMTIQGAGGTRKAVAQGIEHIESMLSEADRARRQRVPASHLTLALQCGGSDGYSGVSANPALGAAADLLVRHGGSAILSETPEIYGAEQLLTRRAETAEVADKLLALIRWWEEHVRSTGGEMDNNPSPGNKEGGLTTILEKSLGAVAKGGSTNLVDVYRYAEPITARGFVFMDSPGYDPCSITGQVASGANIVCFTTGRGSVYGCKPVPSLKLATNSELYRRMTDDIDINCGVILDGESSVEALGRLIFERVLKVASGERTKSEELDFGDNEFVPWRLGAVM